MMRNEYIFPGPAGSNAFFAFDPETVMKDLAERIRAELDGELAMFALRRPEGFVLDGLSGNNSESLQGVHVIPGHGLGGLVIEVEKPVALDDYVKSPAISHQYDQAVVTEQLVSMVALPVVVEGTMAGVAYVAKRRFSPFGDVAIDKGKQIVAETEEDISVALRAEAIASAAVQEERRRAAHQLHDSVGALLFAIEAGAKRIGEVALDNTDVSARAREIVETAAAAGTALRASIEGLASETATAPVATLRADLRELENRSQIAAALVLPDGFPEIADHYASILIATERELVRNVERHSQADRLVVSIFPKLNGVAMVVTDNGSGQADSIIEGVGLSGCRTRLEQIGGSLSFLSDPDEPGLTAKVWIPA